MTTDTASAPPPRVERAELLASLEGLRAEIADPRAGLYGPGSATWRIARHAVIFLGAGRASLLQLAHPFVAHAIARQSDTRRNPTKRFLRTFMRVYAMVFGPLDAALHASERVHAVHTAIHGPLDEDVGRFRVGSRYDALDREALLWVHATLVQSSRQVYELVVRELGPDGEPHYQESKRFARLFGLRAGELPPDAEAFDRWFYDMVASDTIAVGRPAREIARFLLAGPTAWTRPAAAWFRVMTAGLLPPKLRDAFELPFGAREERTFDRSIAFLRRIEPALPAPLRFVPAYRRAMRRLDR